ncbi:hypothetical protein, partial [Streptococcus ruminantium]
RFSILKISIIKSFRSIIEQKKRTNQDSDCQKTDFVRFLYMKLDYCPNLFLRHFIEIAKSGFKEEYKFERAENTRFSKFIKPLSACILPFLLTDIAPITKPIIKSIAKANQNRPD